MPPELRIDDLATQAKFGYAATTISPGSTKPVCCTCSACGKPLSRAQYFRMLHNPIYYGLIRYRTELYEGKHEPIITKKVFEEAQAAMKRRGKIKEPLLKPYLFRKMFRCAECDGVITTETQKGYHYLRCTKKKGPCSQRFMREEEVCKQVDSMLAGIALPQQWIDEMQTELASERQQSVTAHAEHVTALHKKTAQADAKLKRLSDAYLEEALSLAEYRELKNKQVEEKAALQEQTKRFEGEGENRLEPLTRFVKSLQEATLLASTDHSVEKVKLLKKTGSNLTIQDKKIKLNFHEPWKTVENHGRFAQQTKAAPLGGAASRGETNIIFTSAERGGFEPPKRLPVYSISSAAPSATRTPLQSENRQGLTSESFSVIRPDSRWSQV